MFLYVKGNSSVFFTCVCMGFVGVCSVLCVCVVDFLVVVCMGFMNVHLFMCVCVWDFFSKCVIFRECVYFCVFLRVYL